MTEKMSDHPSTPYQSLLLDYNNLKRRISEEKNTAFFNGRKEVIDILIHTYQELKYGERMKVNGLSEVLSNMKNRMISAGIVPMDSEFFHKMNDVFDEKYAQAVDSANFTFHIMGGHTYIDDVLEDGFYDTTYDKVIKYAKVRVII